MNDTQHNKSNNSRGLLKSIISILIIGVCILGVVKFVEYKTTVNRTTSYGNTDGNLKLLSRSARNGDIKVNSDLDLSSLGAKYTIIPQTDISNLQVTISFLDENKKTINTQVKILGNVKKSNPLNFSISLFDLGIVNALKIKYETLTVTGGTVSYFS